MHTAPDSPGVLAEILSRSGPLPATSPDDREKLLPGHIYVAPPNRHLVLEPGAVRVTKGPRENRFRPAIDPLMRSAAQVYGPAAIGVILTGSLDDGTAGLRVIKQLGGTAIVQDPSTALFPSMPASATRNVDVDYLVPLEQIAPLLVELTSAEWATPERIAMPEPIDVEVRIAKEEDPQAAGLEAMGKPSIYACPECHGVLLQVRGGELLRFRCHAGHAYSINSLLAAIESGVDAAMEVAIRSLVESALLMDQMVSHVGNEHHHDVEGLRRAANQARAQSTAIRVMQREREALVPQISLS